MTTTSTTNIVLLVLIVNFVCALSCADAVFAQKGARRGGSRMGKRRTSQTTVGEEAGSWDIDHNDPSLLNIEGAEFFEGDIVVTPDDHCRMRAFGLNFTEPEGGCDEESSSPLSSTQRGTIEFNYGGWYWLTHYDPNYVRPSGRLGRYTIPYDFEEGTNPYGGNRATIAAALAALSAATDEALTFVLRTNEVPYIRVIDGGGCWSYIGKRDDVFSPYQELSLLPNGCVYTRIIQHEFMHALGIFHEQSRPDRDAHVFIHWNNIQSGRENNFATASMINSMGSSYDVDSIMHYGATSFSKNGGPTITRAEAGCSPAEIGTTPYSSIPSQCKYNRGSVLTASDAIQIEYMHGFFDHHDDYDDNDGANHHDDDDDNNNNNNNGANHDDDNNNNNNGANHDDDDNNNNNNGANHDDDNNNNNNGANHDDDHNNNNNTLSLPHFQDSVFARDQSSGQKKDESLSQ